MIARTCLHLCLPFCLLSLGASAAAQPLPWADLLPEDARVAQVTEASLINGQRTTLYKYRSPADESKLVSLWQSRFKHRTVEQRIGGRRTIGALKDGTFYTLQISPSLSGGTEGTVSLTDVQSPRQPVRLPDGLTVPGGTSVLFSMVSQDHGRRSEQFVYANRLSLLENRQALMHRLSWAGYAPDTRIPAPSTPGASLLSYVGRERDALITLERHRTGLSLIVMTFTSTQISARR